MERTLLLFAICLAISSIGVCERAGRKRDLGDEEHYKGEEHNVRYDHEAFLGKEGAKEFDQLKPEEAKRRLGVIVDKIDDDQDGFVSHEELGNWIKHVNHRRMHEYVNGRLPLYDANSDEKLTFEEYQQRQYGTVEDEDAIYDSHRQLTYKQAKKRDQRRFNMADRDNNGELDHKEYSDFLHPNTVPHMKEIVISESMEDKDKDHDGFVTIEEYINDIWPLRDRREGENEPDWVQNERVQLLQHRDKDGDQKLSREELANWIFPPNYDPVDAEATHLIHRSDTDKDKQLTKREILDNMGHFVSSRATDFGEYLNRHDEF